METLFGQQIGYSAILEEVPMAAWAPPIVDTQEAPNKWASEQQHYEVGRYLADPRTGRREISKQSHYQGRSKP